MSVKYGNVELEGPFSELGDLKDSPGVYALLCFKEKTGQFELLQVKTSRRVQTDVANTLRDDWAEFCDGKLCTAVFYGADVGLLDRIKQEILWGGA
jgi:hypothetical protein